MGWPLRMFQEEGYYFVTSRCFQGRLLLRPSAEVNEVVGGVLAKAVQHSAGNVRLHAFTFASNHFHLLVWSRGVALAAFMQYLRANLSKKVAQLAHMGVAVCEDLGCPGLASVTGSPALYVVQR